MSQTLRGSHLITFVPLLVGHLKFPVHPVIRISSAYTLNLILFYPQKTLADKSEAIPPSQHQQLLLQLFYPS
jgi:hypothetical protein